MTPHSVARPTLAVRRGAVAVFHSHKGSDTTANELFLRHHQLIDDVIDSICYHNYLRAQDAEDFRSLAYERLLENDASKLRAYQGRSSMRTYLQVVLKNVLGDHRNHEAGKWHPSTEARRRGATAIRLDQLLSRDNLTLSEAIEVLRTTYRVEESRSKLEQTAAALPPRARRQHIDLESLQEFAARNAMAADQRVVDDEERRLAHRAVRLLSSEIRALDSRDRLVLKLRFMDGMKVALIARALRLDQKPLYRRIESLLSRLRQAFEAEGLTATELGVLLVHGWSDLLQLETNRPEPGS